MSSFCVNTISFKFVAFLRNSSATDTDTDTTSVSKMHLQLLDAPYTCMVTWLHAFDV